jgi:signal transduction histidine kinase
MTLDSSDPLRDFHQELRHHNTRSFKQSALIVACLFSAWACYEAFVSRGIDDSTLLTGIGLVVVWFTMLLVNKSTRVIRHAFAFAFLGSCAVLLLSAASIVWTPGNFVLRVYFHGILMFALSLSPVWTPRWALYCVVAFVGIGAGTLLSVSTEVGGSQVVTAIFVWGTGLCFHWILSFAKYGILKSDFQTRLDIRAAEEPLSRHARLASLGRLLSTITQELAQPLNYAAGGARETGRRLELLRDEYERGTATSSDDMSTPLSSIHAALALVRAGNADMKRLVDGLRAYLQRKIGVNSSADVSSELSVTLELFAPQFAHDKVVVTSRINSVPPVDADSALVGQLLTSLFAECAERATYGGTFQVESSSRDSWVEVSVRGKSGADTGHQTDLSSSSLSVLRELVEFLRGRLEVHSESNGVAFVLWLPALMS